jgi:hypothetical protein
MHSERESRPEQASQFRQVASGCRICEACFRLLKH